MLSSAIQQCGPENSCSDRCEVVSHHGFALYYLNESGISASLVAQRLKRLPVMQETWVRSLGWEDPLEKELATHSRILVWRIPWMEKPGGLQSTGSRRVTTERLNFHFLSMEVESALCMYMPLPPEAPSTRIL